MIGVSGMNDVITIAVKNDGRDERLLVFERGRSFTRRASALSHGGERRNKIVGGPTSQTRVDADGGIQIWVGCSHHGRRGGSG